MGYVYILTNYNKTVLYTGVTNNLQRRLYEHRMGINNGKIYQKNGFNNLYNPFFFRHPFPVIMTPFL